MLRRMRRDDRFRRRFRSLLELSPRRNLKKSNLRKNRELQPANLTARSQRPKENRRPHRAAFLRHPPQPLQKPRIAPEQSAANGNASHFPASELSPPSPMAPINNFAFWI